MKAVGERPPRTPREGDTRGPVNPNIRERFARLAATLASPRGRFMLFVVLVVGLLTVVFTTGGPTRARVESLVQSAGVAAPVAYVLVYVALTVLMFPGSVMTAAGGVLFGAVVGTALTVVAATVGATAAFGIGKWLGRDEVARLAGSRLQRFDDWLERRGFLAILYLRLIPILPFNVLNYGAGVTAIRRRDYVLGTFLGIIPATFAYAALGSNIDDPTSPAFLGAVALIAVLAVGGPVLHRWRRRRSAAGPAPPDEDGGPHDDRIPAHKDTDRMNPLSRCSVVVVIAALALVACGEEVERGHGDEEDTHHEAGTVLDWDAVTAAADGQRVRWWMFGGDERVNRYVDEEVVPAAAEHGVTLERVPVDDTADALQRVVAEQRAGTTEDGSVDLIWINGENFAEGKEAGLWLEDWATQLPNARYVDFDDPTVNRDFGVPVDGQESPWSRAVFVFGYDEERTPDPPRTYDELLAYAEDNPGRVTYPAPPDFTGSAFVRQMAQALGEDEAFALLQEMKPLQWRDGQAFPGNEAELNQLFGNGEVDLAMSYNPNFLNSGVRQGTFPESVRPLTFDSGALQNVSYVTIPANAANQAGALVVANLLLEPRLQAVKADPDRLGIPTVLDLDALDPEDRERFRELTADSPYLLDDYGELLLELGPERVVEIEERWQREVLR